MTAAPSESPLSQLPSSQPQLTRHVTSGGARIYTVSVNAFPHLSANVFLIVVGNAAAPSYTALLDTGSHDPGSTQGLARGLEAIREQHAEAWSWDMLSRVVISHVHPDHLAGLPFVQTLTDAPTAAHALDVANIQNPEAARDAAMLRTEALLAWAGIGGAGADVSGIGEDYTTRFRNRARNLMLPRAARIDTALHGGELLDGQFEVIHTPGHAGGQVCLRLHDTLLCADHLLPHNSPPLMPERAHVGGGLANYLVSLSRIEALEDVTLALGGHGGPMPNWRGRIRQLRERYQDKLQAVLDAADQPVTVHDLTLRLYPDISRVQALLLLDQTGALAEYLAATGQLREQETDGQASLFQRV